MSRRLMDLTGRVFDRLVVIGVAELNGSKTTWWCLCDCGEYIIIRGSSLKNHDTKSCGCLKRGMVGSKSQNWNNGRHVDSDGYERILVKGHPNCDQKGHVKTYRLIWELKHGRFLVKGEVVYHKNEIKLDNDPDNLDLTIQPDYMRLHNNLGVCHG